MGILAWICIWIFSRVERENNAVLQTSFTLALAYLTYYTADVVLEISGVLATVSAALLMATVAWPLFVSHETVEHVWEILEYLANTIIFMLAGNCSPVYLCLLLLHIYVYLIITSSYCRSHHR